MSYRGFYKERDKSLIEVDGNPSGLHPVEDKVLLLPDRVSEQVGQLYKPERAMAQEQMAQVRALLVAVGGNCFEDWDNPIPTIGDRVMVCKYAGIQDIFGADGRYYQLCTDRDITAILSADPAEEQFLGIRKPLHQSKGLIEKA
jgi:co-chaperonin GroES (HSP10)